MAAPAPRRSDARTVVAAALTSGRARLERIVRRRHPAVDASDVVQRTAVRALERSEEVRDLDRVDGWLERIALNFALDAMRGRHGRELVVAEPPEPEREAPRETCACTLARLDGLPPSYADILRRVDIEGETLDEVARALSIEKGNAAVRLHRARRALRDDLRQHCGVESARECLTCACTSRGCCTARVLP